MIVVMMMPQNRFPLMAHCAKIVILDRFSYVASTNNCGRTEFKLSTDELFIFSKGCCQIISAQGLLFSFLNSLNNRKLWMQFYNDLCEWGNYLFPCVHCQHHATGVLLHMLVVYIHISFYFLAIVSHTVIYFCTSFLDLKYSTFSHNMT